MLIESLLDKYPNITYEFAHDGKEAVDKATSSSYDMIFMDINMPNMNGIDATKMIRQREKKDIPIIALTANALEGDRERFLAAGMDDYMAKPIEVKELQRILSLYTPQKEDTKQDIQFNFNNLLKTIKSRLELDDAIIIKLLTAFTQNLKNSCKELEDAFKKNDKETISNLAHKLKGSSSTLALDEIAQMMQQIEKEMQDNIEIGYNDKLKIINSYINLLEDGLKNAT